jgi:hypothetical protein
LRVFFLRFNSLGTTTTATTTTTHKRCQQTLFFFSLSLDYYKKSGDETCCNSISRFALERPLLMRILDQKEGSFEAASIKRICLYEIIVDDKIIFRFLVWAAKKKPTLRLVSSASATWSVAAE